MSVDREPSVPANRGGAFVVVAALAVYIGLLLWLLQPAGGLEGSYFTRGADGREVLVHREVDPRIDFPVPQRLDAAYLFHWNVARDGYPAAMPPYLIRWRGVLLAPLAGDYRFSADARGETALRLDGQKVELAPDAPSGRRLEVGWHPIEIDYALDSGDARLILQWQPPGGGLETIPAGRLAVDPAAHARAATRRALGWILLGAGLLATLLAGRIGRPGPGVAGRFRAALLADRNTIALGAILILAALLRLHDYTLVPFPTETIDEYQHAWEGWHLLYKGFPASWSTFPNLYPKDQTIDFHWFGNRYLLVRPYFDHPPLFSILVGLACTGAGARQFLECSLPVMRLVPIVLSLAGVLLLYRLALAYGASDRAALLAALVYAVLPVIVLSHRLVKGESLLALLFMGAILAVERLGQRGRTRDALLVGCLCGLSIWTKATGVAVPATATLLLLSRRRYRGAALTLLVTAGFALLYLAYAWAYDFGVFVAVMRSQAGVKWAGVESFLDLLQGKVVEQFFGRGWSLWLMLCAALAAVRRERALLVPLAIYASTIVLMADFRVVYGWYRIPLYPFLCVAAGVFLEEMVEASDLFHVLPFAITAVTTGLLYTFHEWPFAAAAEATSRTMLPVSVVWTKGVVLIVMLAFLVPYLLRLVHERPATIRIARAATLVLLAVFLATCLATVGGLLEIYAATRGVR
ncbi:MAG TPA: glycosyltransferase family 39 protein [Patescibacteria group bacterium]|nr:glycosyltransferase family 39 protein [Patescibacteria group bacterium]